MTLSLKYRIALIIFILEAIMMGVVLWQTLGHAQDAAAKHLAESEEVILSVMGGISRIALLTEEYAEIQPYMENLLKDPRIVQAMLVDARGRVVAATRPAAVGKTAPVFNTQNDQRKDGLQVWRVEEINNAAGLVGVLALELSNEVLQQANAASRQLGISIAAVGMAIIAIVGLFVGVMLTRRLQLVTESARRFALGDFEQTTGLQGNDEVGELGRTFDKMASSIRLSHFSLEKQVQERTQELNDKNQELEAFNYSVSHDLRAPLRSIDGFSQALLEDNGHQLDESGQGYLQRIRAATRHMGELIDDMLELARTSQVVLKPETVNLSELAEHIVSRLGSDMPERQVSTSIMGGMTAMVDRGLATILLENLIGNAWKYTAAKEQAQIEFGQHDQDGERVFFVRDNGAGFDMRFKNKLFQAFQRLHSAGEFSGTGVGLATVQRIIQKHRGRVWAEAEIDKGATFFFTLPD